MPEPTNEAIARELEAIADLLETQGDNPFRVRAYRGGARAVRRADRPVAEFAGAPGRLREAAGVGTRIARLIDEFARTGRTQLRQRLEGELDPARAFRRVPGVGPRLARRIADTLQVRSLEELERAAHDGRLARVEGLGPKRLEAVREALAARLSRSTRRREQRLDAAAAADPPVDLLLDLDARYRSLAEADRLRKIAPRRFNPSGEAWLPILEADEDPWHVTVLYSNTARAHDLGRTRDWVVIYYDRGGAEGQGTVVTQDRGALAGKRVVRGREAECLAFYRRRAASA
jgi:hypothetical protein